MTLNFLRAPVRNAAPTFLEEIDEDDPAAPARAFYFILFHPFPSATYRCRTDTINVDR